jgi:hypothetical protein
LRTRSPLSPKSKRGNIICKNNMHVFDIQRNKAIFIFNATMFFSVLIEEIRFGNDRTKKMYIHILRPIHIHVTNQNKA